MQTDVKALVERANRWAMNTGYDGGPDSVPMRMIAALTAQAEEIERLNERLENNRVYDSDGNRINVEPGSVPDGIACRDETIKLQDQKIEELRATLKRAARKAAQEVGR